MHSPAQQGRGDASAPILRTEGLTIRFGGLTALNNVNFEVQRGEIRAVIGPNGAGKSTFFNCLTGVLRPTAGRIVFNGANIAGLPPNSNVALIDADGTILARNPEIPGIVGSQAPNDTESHQPRTALRSFVGAGADGVVP